MNGGGSGMVNLPLGDIVALRVVGTDKYISGWIDRVVIPNFPFPTDPYGSANAPAVCVTYYCNRGDVAGCDTVQDHPRLEPGEILLGARAAAGQAQRPAVGH